MTFCSFSSFKLCLRGHIQYVRRDEVSCQFNLVLLTIINMFQSVPTSARYPRPVLAARGAVPA